MRVLLCSVLLIIPMLAACGGAPKPAGDVARKPYGLLQHPIIDDAAEELVAAAQSAISAKLAPDARERWMIPPIVGEEGDWEASALCFAIASLDGRVRPVQPTQKLASVPAVQAWLRDQELPNAIWVVEVSGVIRPELMLVLCTSQKVWRSPAIPVSVPKAERFTWPFDPAENPPLARVEVGDAEALVELEGEIYVQSRAGLRQVQWYRRAGELRLEKLRPWKDFGRTWVTRNLGAPPDRSPAGAVMRRDLRLEIHDADLPRGEGELVGWYLSRGGAGSELPLRRASAVELLGLLSTPYGWNIPDTWLVLRYPPSGQAYVEMYAVTLRRIPTPARSAPAAAPTPVTILSDITVPVGIPAFDDRMEDTHRLEAPSSGEGGVDYDPLFEWLSPLDLRPVDPTQLADLRTARGRDGIGVMRFSALDSEYPLWRAGSAKGLLAEGDRARWREHRAAPLWGVARLDPMMPQEERRALAAWFAARSPLELFGEERAGIMPSLPITRRPREVSSGSDELQLGAALWLTPSANSKVDLGLPTKRSGEGFERLALLLEAAGAQVAGVGTTAQDAAPTGSYSVYLTRLRVPGAEPVERALALADALGLAGSWPEPLPADAQDAAPDFAERFESWLMEEGHLVPIWNEPGIVFIDRRLMEVRSDSTMLLPDLREAYWIPESELQRLRAQP